MVHWQRRRQGRPARESVSDEISAEQKIDAAVALMMAIDRTMVVDEEARGLEAVITNPTV